MMSHSPQVKCGWHVDKVQIFPRQVVPPVRACLLHWRWHPLANPPLSPSRVGALLQVKTAWKSSKQYNDQRTDQTAFFLAPIITDFIRNTKRELYDEKLEDALEMLDLEWSTDNDTKTQCNRSNTSPLHRGNTSNKSVPARVNGGCSGKHLLNRLPLMTLCFCRNEKCMQKSA